MAYMIIQRIVHLEEDEDEEPALVCVVVVVLDAMYQYQTGYPLAILVMICT